MHTLKITFRPERRKDKTGAIVDSNVQLLAYISYLGRIKPFTGIRLIHIDDFDIFKQRLNGGKKARFGTIELTPNLLFEHLRDFEAKYYNAFKDLSTIGEQFTISDIQHAVTQKLSKKIPFKSLSEKHPFPPQPSKPVYNAAAVIEDVAKSYFETGSIKKARYTRYIYLANSIRIYERITKKPFLINNLTIDDILKLRDFLKDEYKCSKKYPELFQGIHKRLPTVEKTNNTLVTYMGVLAGVLKEKKFPNPLAEGSRIVKSILSEKYDQPFFLTIEELLKCLNSDYPADLKLVRDSFLIQCALGQRVSDYHRTSSEGVLYSESGVPYISYAASKTVDNQKYLEVIETPIVKFAMDIIHEYGYMPFRDYLYGDITTSYNVYIRTLLKHWGIDRQIAIRGDEGIRKVSLYTLGSSKLARKTFVDIINKSQLNPYLTGVHKEGSTAVKRYTDLSLEDKYKLYSMAFRQPIEH